MRTLAPPRMSSTRTTRSANGAISRLMLTPPTLTSSRKIETLSSARMLPGCRAASSATTIAIATPIATVVLNMEPSPTAIPESAAITVHCSGEPAGRS